MVKKLDGPRIILPDSFREPGTPENVLFRCRGTKNSNGKEVSFDVPDTISKKGLEDILRNVRLPIHQEAMVYDLLELFE